MTKPSIRKLVHHDPLKEKQPKSDLVQLQSHPNVKTLYGEWILAIITPIWIRRPISSSPSPQGLNPIYTTQEMQSFQPAPVNSKSSTIPISLAQKFKGNTLFYDNILTNTIASRSEAESWQPSNEYSYDDDFEVFKCNEWSTL